MGVAPIWVTLFLLYWLFLKFPSENIYFFELYNRLGISGIPYLDIKTLKLKYEMQFFAELEICYSCIHHGTLGGARQQAF